MHNLVEGLKKVGTIFQPEDPACARQQSRARQQPQARQQASRRPAPPKHVRVTRSPARATRHDDPDPDPATIKRERRSDGGFESLRRKPPISINAVLPPDGGGRNEVSASQRVRYGDRNDTTNFHSKREWKRAREPEPTPAPAAIVIASDAVFVAPSWTFWTRSMKFLVPGHLVAGTTFVTVWMMFNADCSAPGCDMSTQLLLSGVSCAVLFCYIHLTKPSNAPPKKLLMHTLAVAVAEILLILAAVNGFLFINYRMTYPKCGDRWVEPVSSSCCSYDTGDLVECSEAHDNSYCLGDGTCGSTSLNNCNSKDVYYIYNAGHEFPGESISCPTTTTTKSTTTTVPVSTTLGACGRDVFEPVCCPLYAEAEFKKNDLKTCDKVGIGEYCEAKGECGTDPNLDNYKETRNIYIRREEGFYSPFCNGTLCTTPQPTTTTTTTTTPKALCDLFTFEPLCCPEHCPSDGDVSRCDSSDVAVGDLCLANSEPCTDLNLDNCGGEYDIYRKRHKDDELVECDPTQCMDSTPAPPPMCGDSMLEPICCSVDCPSRDEVFPPCDAVADGHLCMAQGECNTDANLNNCGDRSIYIRHSPGHGKFPECVKDECATTTPPIPQCDLSVLEPLCCKADCPSSPEFLSTCDETFDGDLCRSNGECHTDPNLNNCGGYSVYRRHSPTDFSPDDDLSQLFECDPETMCGVTTPEPAHCGASYLQPICCPTDCPADADLPACDTVGNGRKCEGDGECGTNDDQDNCGTFDVYIKLGPHDPKPEPCDLSKCESRRLLR